MTRILIVEDDENIANGLRFNLEAEGFDVRIVGTGEQGLGRAARCGAERLSSNDEDPKVYLGVCAS